MTADMRTRAAETVCELFQEDPRVAVVLAEISVERFSPALRHDPTRAVNLGIMEQTMVGVAAGFAMEGFHPIVHTIAPFVAERGLEQLKLDFANQELGGLVITVGGSYDYASEGTTHHSPGDVQALLTIPGAEVLVPGSGEEAAQLIRATYDNGRLTYMRTQVRANGRPRDVRAGRLSVERRGSGPTVIAVGPMLDRTLEALHDTDATVLYATRVAPFDAPGLRAAVTGDEVVIVEPMFAGTLAPLVAAALDERPTRIRSIGVPRRVIRAYGTPEQLDADAGLDTAGIRAQLFRE
jgi:transketolase